MNHLCSFPPMTFFFSSRRRHTRCLSDWSSDVCSSDLAEKGRVLEEVEVAAQLYRNLNFFKYATFFCGALSVLLGLGLAYFYYHPALNSEPDTGQSEVTHQITRSEKRRVGKERRYRQRT